VIQWLVTERFQQMNYSNPAEGSMSNPRSWCKSG